MERSKALAGNEERMSEKTGQSPRLPLVQLLFIFILFSSMRMACIMSVQKCTLVTLGRVVLSVVGETSKHHHEIHLQSSLSYY